MTEIERDPSYSEDNLIWIDMEMTGLQPEVNLVIEVAAIITDKELNILHEGPVVAVHQSDEVLGGMDDWNTETHTRSGLVKRVRESTIDETECERIFLETFRRFVPEGKSPMSAIRSVRTGASWRAGCRTSNATSTTATWTCRPSRSLPAAGRPNT